MRFEIIDQIIRRHPQWHTCFVVRRGDDLYLVEEKNMYNMCFNPKIGEGFDTTSNADYYEYIHPNRVIQVWDNVTVKIGYAQRNEI